MRVIEKVMLDAFVAGRNKCRANDEIVVDTLRGTVSWYLHGNLIAEKSSDFVLIRDAGWQTNTTKSRLNAILWGLGINCYIYQSQYQWYVRNITKGVIDTFYDGYTTERKHNGN